jgi:FkbM family methyltransferase
VNPVWFVRNVATSWRYRADIADFIQRLFFSYAAKLPRVMRKPEWVIGFRYPEPVGRIRLVLRANAGADAFTHSEIFEHQYYSLPLDRSPATVLDLGANIGLSAIYFSRAYPSARLACVEPVADNLRIMAQNLRLNDVEAEIISAAVDVADGQVVMRRDAMDFGHQVISARSDPSAAHFEVPALSVPSILRRLGWDRIGLLKVDIEGHEQRLFADDCDWLHRVDAMCLEYHHDSGDVELGRIAGRFGFLPPRRLPGAIWLLARPLSPSQERC